MMISYGSKTVGAIDMLDLFSKDKSFGYAQLDRNHRPIAGTGPSRIPEHQNQPQRITKGALEAQETMRKASGWGQGGALLGGLAGTLLTGNPLIGSTLGNLVGGGIGQAAGGVMPTAKDALGYAGTGLARGTVGGAIGGATDLGSGLSYGLGAGALSGFGNILGLNMDYSPRMYYDQNTGRIDRV